MDNTADLGGQILNAQPAQSKVIMRPKYSRPASIKQSGHSSFLE